jgi:hypothetical protein
MSKPKHPKDWLDTIWVQPIDRCIYVVRPSSLAKFVEHMEYHGCNKYFIKDVKKMTKHVKATPGNATYYSDDAGNNIMVLPDEYDEMATYHEALHAAVRLWHNIGAQLKLPRNDEVLTYTQGDIVRNIKRQIYKMKVK